MQIKHYLIIALLFSFFLTPAFAQQPVSGQVCGYTGKSPWLEWYQQHRDELAAERGVDTAWLYVPVTLHIVGTYQGTGYYKFEQALRNMCEMNEYYEDSHIRFYLMPGDPVRYHNNSSWYEHEFFPGGDEMINENRLPGRLNLFVVKNPAGNCGYSWQDAIVMGTDYGCSDPGNATWAHEAGHHLSLPHPFVGWEGFDWDYSEPAPEDIDGHPVEKVDGSNCLFGGDGFCDTDPDYLANRWPCDGDKKSYTAQTDPDGVEFHSDGTLIMGYSFDECTSRFTPDQIEAMRTNLYTEHSAYLQITEPLESMPPNNAPVELVSPIDTQNVQYNNFTLTWNPLPGANFYFVEVGLAPVLAPRYYSKMLYNTTSVTLTNNIPNNRTLKWRVRAYSEWDVCNVSGIQYGVFKTRDLTATNDLEKTITAELAPNPVSAGLPAVLTVTSDEFLNTALSVTDAMGRQCLMQNVRLSPGENRIDIATTGLSAGFYVVTLRNEKGSLVKRLAIAK